VGTNATKSNLNINTQEVDNSQGATIFATQDTSINLSDQGKLNNDNSLIASNGQLSIHAQQVSNKNTKDNPEEGIQGNRVDIYTETVANSTGEILAVDTLNIQGLTNAINNTDGIISSTGDLNINTDQDTTLSGSINNTNGQIKSGTDVNILVNNLVNKGSITAGEDLNLYLDTDYIHEVGSRFSAGRTATLNTTKDIINKGILESEGQLTLNSENTYNQVDSIINATADVDIQTKNIVDNRGIINSQAKTLIKSNHLNNIGDALILGEKVTIDVDALHNAQDSIGGVFKAGAIVSRDGDIHIGVKELNNEDEASIYSSKGLYISGALDDNGEASSTILTKNINNISATIESAEAMLINAEEVTNERRNVENAIRKETKTTTKDLFIHSWMDRRLPAGAWYGHNFRIHQIYYLDPSAILSNETFITPDGYRVGKAVVKLTPKDSAFHVWTGDLYSAAGEQHRDTISHEQTRTVYYTIRTDNVGNPDHGFSDAPIHLHTPGRNWKNILNHSSDYGNCTNNCVRLHTLAGYDPNHHLLERRQHPHSEAGSEYKRTTEHTTITDTLNETLAGSHALISAGTDMHINIGNTLNNKYGYITATKDLYIDGQQSVTNPSYSKITNIGKTLYTEHRFKNTTHTYGYGSNTWIKPSVTEAVGKVEGVITAGGTLGISVAHLANQDLSDPVNVGKPNFIAPVKPTHANPPSIIEIPLVTDEVEGIKNTVRMTSVNLNLPTSSLYSIHPQGSKYLVETDPRFTNRRQFLSSDYLLESLKYETQSVHKRLGDGYYEQKLIQDQILRLTGKQFLGDYTNKEKQYQDLMQNAITFASKYNLRPGIALTPDQVARLTSDIVWLVEQEITLADGSTTLVLTPQIYTKLQPADIDRSGALLSAKNLDIKLSDDLHNSGTISGRTIAKIDAKNIDLLKGKIKGDIVGLKALENINLTGGRVEATEALIAKAGQDINITTTTYSESHDSTSTNGTGNFHTSHTSIDRIAGLYIDSSADTGTLIAQAGNNLNLTGALIQNQPSRGITQLQAGKNVNLATVTTHSKNNSDWDSRNYTYQENSTEHGTTISSTGAIQIQAANDLNARAAQVNTQDNLVVQVGNSITIKEGRNKNYTAVVAHREGGSFLAKKSTTTVDIMSSDTSIASNLEGKSIIVEAGSDIQIQGSNLISDELTYLSAENITIKNAEDRYSSSHYRETQKRGFLSSGGFGFSYGKQKQTSDYKDRRTLASPSTLGSITGDTIIQAKEQYHQIGSDILSPQGDITIQAKDIDISEARQTFHSEHTQTFEQTGLSVSLSNPVLSAGQSMGNTLQAMGKTKSSRMQALGVGAIALEGYNTYQALTDPEKSARTKAIQLSISLGGSSSYSKGTQANNTSRGSSLVGDNLTLIAHGGGEQSNITIEGSQLQAQKQITLDAENNLQLLASLDQQRQSHDSNSSSSSLGIAIGGSSIVSVNLSASKSKALGRGNSDSYTKTTLLAEQVNLNSGNDTILYGSIVEAEQIQAKIGGKLHIESPQTQEHYQGNSSHTGGSLSIGVGAIPVTGSMSRGKTNSHYQSVEGGQSGFKAGDQGFQVEVGGETTLIGGAITSTEQAQQENKDSYRATKTHIQHLENQANYQARGHSITIGTSVGESSYGSGSDSGNTHSTTTAGITGIAGDKTKRTGDQEQGIQRIFNQQAVEAEVKAQIQITQAFSQQAAKAVGTYANQQLKSATQKRAEAKRLREAGNYQQADQLQAEADRLEQDWEEGGNKRVALHTLTGGLTGNLQGALGAMTNQRAIAEVGEAIEALDAPEAVKQTLIQIAGATLGVVAGGRVGAGAALNATANNYLNYLEAQELIALQKKQDEGNCDSLCENRIQAIKALDSQRDRALNACKGISSQSCEATRQEVRNFAAEFIEKGGEDYTGLTYKRKDNLLTSESQKTIRLAYDTLEGSEKLVGGAKAIGKGAYELLKNTVDLFNSVLLSTVSQAEREKILEAIEALGSAMVEVVTDPSQWKYLVGALQPEQRARVAQAYRDGDGEAIGAVLAEQVLAITETASLVIPGVGVAGATAKVAGGTSKVNKLKTATQLKAEIKKQHVETKVTREVTNTKVAVTQKEKVLQLQELFSRKTPTNTIEVDGKKYQAKEGQNVPIFAGVKESQVKNYFLRTYWYYKIA
jgi:filamentous hemagglutinin